MKEIGFTVKQVKWVIAALVFLYIISVLVNLGMMELDGEEPRRAVVSLEMMHSGNYLNPSLFGWPYLNKPPFFNWILIGSMQLLQSVSEFVLRLPSLFFYVLWAGVHYRFTKRFFSKELALLSAFMMLTCADIYFYGLANGAEIDIFYSFIVYLQAIALFHFFLKQQWLKLFLVSYALGAIGFLTKGFPSILFEGLTLVALCFFAKSIKPLFRWQHLMGGLLFLAMTGLYFWGYNFKGNANHLLINFLNESLVKSAIGERSHKVFEKAVGYPVLVLKLLAPWSLLLLTLFVNKVRQQVLTNPFVRFSLLFIACNLWVYWFTGQPKARYIYMFVPFATTLFVQLYQSFIQVRPEKMYQIWRWLGWIFVLCALAFALLPIVAGIACPAGFICALLLGVFCWQYFRSPNHLQVWMFIGGIIMLRLVYAIAIIPFQARNTAHYQAPLQTTAQVLKGGQLYYYAPPQQFGVAVETKIFSWRADTIPVPPLIHPQVPYYYYKHTGKLLQYDTILTPGRNYISFAQDLKGKMIDSVFSFRDKRGAEEMVVYRLKAGE